MAADDELVYDYIDRSDIVGLRRCIVGRVDINSASRYNSILHHAVYWSKIECVQLLLEAGANVDSKNPDGNTPLHLASSISIMELLLDYGADINAVNNDGSTPLRKRTHDIISFEFLIGKGANVNIASSRLLTPLHIVVSCNAPEKFVELLLGANANANIQDKFGNTPLHYACNNNNVANVKLLLQAGAKVNIKNEKGDTPLHYSKSIPIMELLHSHNADINALNNENETVLHEIIQNGHFEAGMNCIQWLCDQGANVHIKTKYSWTALHYASDSGMDKYVKLLLEHGADASAKTDLDATAQFLAHARLERQVMVELEPEEIASYSNIEILLSKYAFKNVKSARRT